MKISSCGADAGRSLVGGDGHVLQLVDEFVHAGLGQVLGLLVGLHSTRRGRRGTRDCNDNDNDNNV